VPERYPEAVRPRGAAPPTAERSELGAELGRVVYGRAKAVGYEGSEIRDEKVDRRGEDENCGPRNKNWNVGQRAEQRVAAVANLQRPNAAHETARPTGCQSRSVQTHAGQDFQRHEHQKNNRNRFPTIHMYLLVILPSEIVKKCTMFHEPCGVPILFRDSIDTSYWLCR
jgi:hypothetical protein